MQRGLAGPWCLVELQRDARTDLQIHVLGHGDGRVQGAGHRCIGCMGTGCMGLWVHGSIGAWLYWTWTGSIGPGLALWTLDRLYGPWTGVIGPLTGLLGH